MWFRLLAVLALGLVVSFLLPRIFLVSDQWLNRTASWGTILTGVAAVIALASFLYQSRRDNTLAVIDQIAFYREKVIPAYQELDDTIRSFRPLYTSKTAILQNFEAAEWFHTHKQVAEEQRNLLDEDVKSNNMKIVKAELHLLNSLEEFALRILETDTPNHKALDSVKGGFVLSVEQNLSGLFYIGLNTGATYPGIKALYSRWRDQVDRRSSEERIKRLVDDLAKK